MGPLNHERGLEGISRDLQSSFKKNLRDYAEALFFIILLAVVVRAFFIGSYKVGSDQLSPTLEHGDFILGFKPPAQVRLPFTGQKFGSLKMQPGDLLVFRCGLEKQERCVRRLAGLPGDRLEFSEGELRLNGAVFARHLKIGLSDGVQIVPPGKAYVLGEEGLIDIADFEAKPLIIWFSKGRDLENATTRLRWERIGNWLY